MLIGLVGFINCGKGTIADLLVERHDFVKESFANSVKDACAAIFGWNRAMLEGDTPESRAWREEDDEWWTEKLEYPFSPRYALQLMGTEAGRNVFHKDLWVHTVMRRCKIAPWNNYVIADVRFPNEIKAIHDAGGKVVRVHRGPDPQWYNLALVENTTHEDDLWLLEDKYQLMEIKYPKVHYSEWAWIGSEIDFTIDNNGDIGALTKQVDELAKTVYNSGSIDKMEIQNETK